MLKCGKKGGIKMQTAGEPAFQFLRSSLCQYGLKIGGKNWQKAYEDMKSAWKYINTQCLSCLVIQNIPWCTQKTKSEQEIREKCLYPFVPSLMLHRYWKMAMNGDS